MTEHFVEPVIAYRCIRVVQRHRRTMNFFLSPSCRFSSVRTRADDSFGNIRERHPTLESTESLWPSRFGDRGKERTRDTTRAYNYRNLEGIRGEFSPIASRGIVRSLLVSFTTLICYSSTRSRVANENYERNAQRKTAVVLFR